MTPTELSESVLHTAMRTQESVILDDASAQAILHGRIHPRKARPLRALPSLGQTRPSSSAHCISRTIWRSRVFTSAKLAVLKLLASQAAISLENVRLYDELRSENSERRRAEAGLRRSEAYLTEAQKLSHTGTFGWRPASGEIYWSEETFRIFEYDPATIPTMETGCCAGFTRTMLPPFGRSWSAHQMMGRILLMSIGCGCRMKGSNIFTSWPVPSEMRPANVDFVGAVMDVTAIRLAERELHKTRIDLAHVTRVTSLGELTASIAHEVNQPLGAVMFNAEACLSWLDGDRPNMSEARAALERIVRDGTRAGEVIRRIRALANKTETKMAPLNLNEVLSEALTFVQHELLSSQVALRVEQARALPIILADKVQLQQVILNLVANGIEAMQSITDRPRELVIRSQQDDARKCESR